MRVVCSYCRADMGEKAPLEDPTLTHGMCEDCLDHFSRIWGGLSLGEYLDELPLPAVVVEGEGRIVAANQRMAELLGKPQREVFGLLGGEAFGCAYARLPGGCGQTTHCRECTIRITVEAARESRSDQEGVLAWLDTDEGRVHMRITTRFRASPDRVLLFIDETAPPQ